MNFVVLRGNVMRRSIVAIVTTAVMAVTLAACGGDDADAVDDLGTPASSSPTATSSPTPVEWSATVPPERPQDEPGAAGAEAFAQFAARTVFYVLATGDAPALSAISDLGSCALCKDWDADHHSGKVVSVRVPKSEPALSVVGDPVASPGDFYQVTLSMDIPRGTKLDKKTNEKIDNVKAAKDVPFVADVQWKDDSWVLMRYDFG